MGKVVYIEDYRPNQTSEVLWARINSINNVIAIVKSDSNSTIDDWVRLERLVQLKEQLIDKVLSIMKIKTLPLMEIKYL